MLKFLLAPEGAPVTGGAPAATSTAPAAPTTNVVSEKSQTTNVVPKDTTPQRETKPSNSPELHEVKINGKLERLTLEQIKERASKAEAADRRFQEASQLTKKAEAVLGKLRSPKDAIAFLESPELNLNPDEVRAEFEAWYERKFIAREKMTPEQRELADAKARLQKYEDDEKSQKEAIEREENERLDNETRESIQTEVKEILESGKLPKSRFIVARVAYWTRVNETKGINAPREQIIAQVKKEMSDIHRSMVESSDGETLINLLGEDTVRKLRKFDLERLRAKRGKGPGIELAPTQKPTPERRERKQKLRGFEVNQNLKGIRLGRR